VVNIYLMNGVGKLEGRDEKGERKKASKIVFKYRG
jgi:hypothetical protein